MNIIGIIPARMASTRFPNKPMAKIFGLPMIGHVYHRCLCSNHLSDLWVATCDKEIYDYIGSFGGKVVMTSDSHERASDRSAEALIKIEQKTGQNIDYVAMIQGDEPMVTPEMISALVKPTLEDGSLKFVNLISKISDLAEFNSANTVKLVLDQKKRVLYFSREPIPSRKKYSADVPMWKQLGMMLFQRELLLDYIKMAPTPLEIIESVDMNRLLEHGVTIHTAETDIKTAAVDTPSDLVEVERLMSQDVLVKKYLS